MRLALGAREHELAWRALVVGVAGVIDGAGFSRADAVLAAVEHAVALGADAVDVGCVEGDGGADVAVLDALAVVAARVDVPLWVGAASDAAVDAAASAGAAVVALDAAVDAGCLERVASRELTAVLVASPPGASLVGGAGMAAREALDAPALEACLVDAAGRASAAGIPPHRLVLDAGLDAAADAEDVAVRLDAGARLAAGGFPVALSLVHGVGASEADRAAPLAASAFGVARGARLVRTLDVRGARRVVDVLAAVLGQRDS